MTIRILGWALVAGSLAVVGCRPDEKIEAYTVPKEAAPTAVAAAPPATLPRATMPGTTIPGATANRATEPTDRMLAAVLPDGERAWFFKVTGPIAQLEPLAADVETFFASVRPASAKPRPGWTIPSGWQEQPGSGMRAATILIPTSGGQHLELTVIGLPWSGVPGELLSNVNRWRGQMQLPPVDQAGLAKDVREIRVDDATLTVVDLRGSFQSGSMTPPFAGGAAAAGAPPVAAAPVQQAESDALPPGHPPVAAESQAPSAPSAAPFKFDLPEGWQSRPAAGMRKVDLLVEDADKSAVFTAIDFPANSPPMMSDPVANVRRWRGEVGLPPLSDDEIKATMQPFEVDGTKAMLVEAVPEAGQPQADRATIAAMFTRAGAIWFFKLSGDRDVVAAQKEKFESFLKSVRFADAGGADNGN